MSVESVDRGVPDRGRVQAAIARMHARRGSAFMLRLALLGVQTLTAVTGGVMMAWIAGYLELSAGQAAVGYLIMIPTIGLGTALGVRHRRESLRTAMRWSKPGSPEERAPATWDAVVRGFPRVILSAYIGGLIGCVPAAAAMVAVWHEPAYTGPPLWIALATGGAASLVVGVFASEMLLRPMVEDIAGHLPPGHEPAATGVRLRTKALAPLPIVALYGALTVGAFADVQTSGSARLAIALGIAFLTIIVTAVVLLVITRSVLAPLDELLNATERVRRGDLTRPVPVVSADDLGELARSFNLMLEGLRDRETLQRELRASRKRIVAAGDAERRRVERELHDGAQQQLTVVGLKLGVLERLAKADPEIAPLAAELRHDLHAALAELRSFAHGIYPLELENDGLAAALTEFASKSGIPVSVSSDGTARYDSDLEAAVYFCCQEALRNAAQHAGDGARVQVSLAEHDRSVLFAVKDDGVGFDPDWGSQAPGLQNMADRIGALGGELRVHSRPGRGTIVWGRVPVR